MSKKPPGSTWTRRRFLQGSIATGVLGIFPGLAWSRERRDTTGTALDATAPGGIDLHIRREWREVGGRRGEVITYNGAFPGPVIRMKEGKTAHIRVHNHLDESTSIHWHGILLPFNMDGVPGISYAGIAPGETFAYTFKLRQSGTYWYHSHSGFQEQLGHYGQLIVEPAAKDPVEYDIEHSIVLSDWTVEDPEKIFAKLKKIEGYYNFQRPVLANLAKQARNTNKRLGQVIAKRWKWNRMRMDPTDLLDVTGATYSYLINGHAAHENPTFLAKPGQRVRLRLTNASAMTYFDVRIPGLPMTVVQADGQDIVPVETDELRIAVAETYDVIVELPRDKAYTFFAETMDRSGFARATLAPREGMRAAVPSRRPRPMLGMADMGMMHQMDGGGQGSHGMEMNHATGHEDMPRHDAGELPVQGLPDAIPHGDKGHGPASISMVENAYRQLDDPGVGLGGDGWRVLTYGQLQALKPPPDRRPPTREIDLHLTGNMQRYVWGFDGLKWSESDMLRFVYGERLRINFYNDTMMTHPIHLHGIWMDLYTGGDYSKNPRKHTVSVQPAELLTVDITVDAPGQWAFHCHLLYHMEAGMFRTVAVVRSLEGEAKDATR